MKLLIDVPDDIYASKQYCDYFSAWSEKLSETFRNGTPLPSRHGRLIDENKITRCKQIGLIIKNGNVVRCLATDAPTVIPSNNGEEDV